MKAIRRPTRWKWVMVGLLANLLAMGSVPLPAQFPFNPPQIPEYTPGERLRQRLPFETSPESALQRATVLIEQQDYETAITTLQSLIESGEDYFRFTGSDEYSSALKQAETLLFSLPPEAREVYERRYGAQATQALERAHATNDLAAGLEVARLYPLTAAARLALRLAAETAFDQGEPALAARLWGRLLPHTEAGPERTTLLLEITRAWTQAGFPSATNDALTELHASAQSTPLSFEGKLLAPPDKADRVWLEKVFGAARPRTARRNTEWWMNGGHASRWSDGPFAHPVQAGHWTYPLIDRYDFYTEGRMAAVLKDLNAMEARYIKNVRTDSTSSTPIQIGSPVVVGDQVFVAGYGTVKALDRRTGELRWSGVAIDETFRYLTEQNFAPDDASHPQYMSLLLGQRAWVNRTASSLSSDGQRVFSIHDTGVVGVFNRAAFGMMGRNQIPPRHELIPPSENRLSAYDAQTGLLLWVAGGPMTIAPTEGLEEAPQTVPGSLLPGAFFLGAPLIVDGQVIVLAEDHGQVRVFSLDPQTGETRWSLPLVNPIAGIAFDEVKRFYGLTPSYVDGLLICPTGEGLLVAVDPVMRRVEWVHQYSTRSAVTVDPRWGRAVRTRPNAPQEFRLDSQIKDRQWIDTNPILAGSRLLYPAADTGMLYGINPLDGQPLWQIERGDGLFIAGCTERHAIIVGERSVRAIRLDDPRKIVWSLEIPCPAGRGVLCGGNYLLPVRTNEILAINLQSGRLLARTPVHEQIGGGSLIAAGDQLLLQTTTHLVGFRSLASVETEIAASLEQADRRGAALAQQGELLLCRGQTDEGITAIRSALDIQDFPNARRLLVWTLLDRLKSNFAAARDQIPELKRLATDPDQKQLLGRWIAEGREKQGERLEAFQEYLDFIPSIKPDSMIPIDERVVGREDRWLRGRLVNLYLNSTPEEQSQLLRMIDATITAHPEPGIQRSLANVLGIELAPQLHLSLAINNQFETWSTMRILWTLTESSAPVLQARAAARLVAIEVPLKRGHHVTHLIRSLQTTWADVEFEPGITGHTFLEKLPEPVQLELTRLAAIREPVRPMLEEKPGRGTPAIKELLPAMGAKHGPFADWLFGFESPASSVVAGYDGTGKSRANANFGPMGDQQQRAIRYVQTDANLVLIGLRDQFKIISPLDDAAQERFSAPLAVDENPYMGRSNARPKAAKAGYRHPLWSSPSGTIGNVGPLNFDTLVYLQGNTLTAVSPLSATSHPRVHWRRTEIAPGSEICADENYVVVLPPLTAMAPYSSKWQVLRAADGVQIAERAPPAGLVDRRYADWGRMFLVTRPMGEANRPRSQWAMYDPVSGRDLWSIETAGDTRWAPVNGSDLAFLTSTGELTLVDWKTGQSRWTTHVPHGDQSPHSFSVTVDSQRMYLHTEQPSIAGQATVRDTVPSESIRVNGIAAAIDSRDGKVLWSSPMEQQLFRPGIPAAAGILTYCATRRKDTEVSPQTQLVVLDAATGDRLLDKQIISLGTGEGWAHVSQGLLLRVCGYDLHVTVPSLAVEEKRLDEQREPEVPLKAQ